MSIDSVNNRDDRHLNPNNDKELLLKRLRRIEGQIKGIQGMVENERYCVDILTQISAAKSAINAVGNMILENHIRGCVKEAIEQNEDDKQELIDEMIELMVRYSK